MIISQKVEAKTTEEGESEMVVDKEVKRQSILETIPESEEV